MDINIKDEGGVANINGVSRRKNPYTSHEDTDKAYDWDIGWLKQTQHWAGKPETMCKGKNCTNLHGQDNHSKECHQEHDGYARGLMPHFEI